VKDFVSCNCNSSREHRRTRRVKSLVQGRLWKWTAKGAIEAIVGDRQAIVVIAEKEEE